MPDPLCLQWAHDNAALAATNMLSRMRVMQAAGTEDAVQTGPVQWVGGHVEPDTNCSMQPLKS